MVQATGSQAQAEAAPVSACDALLGEPQRRGQRLLPAAVDINDVIERMVRGLRRTFGPGYEIVVLRDERVPRALVDAQQLAAAVLNLALDARDAMPEGGRVTLETGATMVHAGGLRAADLPAGRYATLAVSDRGPGLHPAGGVRASQLRLFRSEEARSGAGLGLATIGGFACHSGGHVRVFIPHGSGTTVKLFLPALTTGEDDDGGRRRGCGRAAETAGSAAAATHRPEAHEPFELAASGPRPNAWNLARLQW